mmetsp:Transcript_24727/g.36256  ORF Transcript_24727/g.36256 Transcript_24727/m.36256 type:complete len:265 (+) Transcript_24727:33-827(+)|eukprot:CAMPEP_0195526584 /NCGR_PEP_ID=MMETSP0794_2-20130614/27742_1 /TAXON_ID=515487 /ORGANISM="Stephanopyxis turris, Strain CCMP 815" /LENGTH=264 /DNA_ID=CAMNT_0040657311 /DNA_START=29 /DNA_END=823 /DNA_ORIENTATION=-
MSSTEPRTVLYCGACGMPPEYCEYGPDYESHCVPWLTKNYPSIYRYLEAARKGSGSSKKKAGDTEDSEDAEKADVPTRPWTFEERLVAFYSKYMPEKLDNVPALLVKYEGKEEKLFTALVKKYGDEPDDPYNAQWSDDSDDDDGAEKLSSLQLDDKKKRRGVGAKKVNKVDTRVIIQKISRNKKKAVTIIVGMDTVPDMNLKDAAKAFSKRFAGSSSVKDTPQGKEIIIQGDHSDEVATMIVDKFKVSPSAVFQDVGGEFVPVA